MISFKWQKIIRAVAEPNQTFVSAADWLIHKHPEYTEQDKKEIRGTAKDMDECPQHAKS